MTSASSNSPFRFPLSMKGRSTSPWKALFLAGLSSSAWSGTCGILTVSSQAPTSPDTTFTTSMNINESLPDDSGSSQLVWRSLAANLGSPGTPDYQYNSADLFLRSDSALSSPSFLLNSDDILSAVSAKTLFLQSSFDLSRTLLCPAGETPSTVDYNDTIYTAIAHLYDTKFIIDASATTSGYTVAVGLNAEEESSISIKTSNDTGASPSDYTKADVTLSTGLTGKGTIGQKGKRGSIILEAGAENFEGTLEIDNNITTKAFLKLRSLKNPLSYAPADTESGSTLNMDFSGSEPTSATERVRFDVTSGSAYWECPITAQNANTFMRVHKKGTGSLSAKSRSPFSGGVVIEEGAINIYGGSASHNSPASVLNANSSAFVSGPLGVGTTTVYSGAELHIDNYVIHNNLNLYDGSTFSTYESGTASALSTITIGAGVSGGSSAGVEFLSEEGGYLNVYGQIIAASDNASPLLIIKDEIHFHNQKTGATTNTYGGTTRVTSGAHLHVHTPGSIGGTGSLTALEVLGGIHFTDLPTESTIANTLALGSGSSLNFGDSSETSTKTMTYSGAIKGYYPSDASSFADLSVGANKKLILTDQMSSEGETSNSGNTSSYLFLIKKGLGTATFSHENNLFQQLFVLEGIVQLGASQVYDESENPLGRTPATIERDGTLDLNGHYLGEVLLLSNSNEYRDNSFGESSSINHYGATLTNTSSTAATLDNLDIRRYYGDLALGDVSTNSTVNIATMIGDIIVRDISSESSAYYSGNTAPAAPTNPFILKKTGSHTLTLGESASLRPDLWLDVTAGSARVLSETDAGSKIILAANTEVYLETEEFEPGESEHFYPVMANGTIETTQGSSLVSINGWRDLTGAATGAGALSIAAATSTDRQGTLSIHDNFAISGNIGVSGILEVECSSDKIFMNTIAGTGLIKKYGSGQMALSAEDLSGFEGAIVVYDGTVRIPAAALTTGLSESLKIYAGPHRQAVFPLPDGAYTAPEGLAGNIFGYTLDANGNAIIGYQSYSTQDVTANAIPYDGNNPWIIQLPANTAMARLVARSVPEGGYGIENLYIENATWSLSGMFESQGESTPEGIVVKDGGTAILEPGFFFESGSVTVQDGGLLKIHGFNIDRDVQMDNIILSTGSELRIGIDKINAQDNAMTVHVIERLTATGGDIVLNIDLNATATDKPLLTLAKLPILSENTTITVAPQGVIANTLRLPLLKMPTVDENSEELITTYAATAANVIARLRAADSSFALRDAMFDANGVLSCLIGDRMAPVIPQSHSSLGNRILSYENSIDALTQELNALLMQDNLSQEDVLHILKALQPLTSSLQTANGPLAQQITTVMSIIQKISAGQSLNQLMKAQGDRSTASAKFLKASLESEMTGRNLLSGKVARATDSNTQIRMQDYQNLNLSGLSFSSETSYAHQSIEETSVAPASTQHSWTTSLSATYNHGERLAYGAVVSTAKINQNVSPNQEQKTGHRGDAYNTAGLLGVYQGESKPWYIAGVATYGQHNYDVQRTWMQPQQNSTSLACQAVGEYKGYELYVTAELGWKFQRSETMMIQPFVGYINSHLSTTAYQETSTNVSDGAANDYGIIAPAQSVTNQAYNTGIEVQQMGTMEDMKYQVSTRVGWTTQKNSGETSTYTYAYLGAPADSYDIVTDNKRYNTFDLSFGVHTQVKDNLFVNAIYTGNFGASGNTNTLMASLEYHLG